MNILAVPPTPLVPMLCQCNKCLPPLLISNGSLLGPSPTPKNTRPIDPHRESQFYTRGIVSLPWVCSCRAMVKYSQTRVRTSRDILFPCLLHPARYQSRCGRPAFLFRGHYIPILVWPPIPGLWVWLRHGWLACENCRQQLGLNRVRTLHLSGPNAPVLPSFISVYSMCNSFPDIHLDSTTL